MRLVALLLTVCVLLSGCASWMEGSYYSVKPHEEQGGQEESGDVAVSSYSGLYRALENMIHDGKTSGIISVSNYNQLVVARDMRTAVQETMNLDPIGAYAVEDIRFEVGTNAGQPAIAVEIAYIHDRTEIKNIHHAENMDDAQTALAEALYNCDPGVVLNVTRYEGQDVAQWVADYAQKHPDKVMEAPQVTVNHYPETGFKRVLEIKFTYQNSRETLRSMRTQVESVFYGAQKRLGAMENQEQAYEVLYGYLMERLPEVKTETSLTPAYSLLIQGVGDHNAFATVYGAMCRRANLESIVVTGTKNGQPYRWNVIKKGEIYYHLDLLASRDAGQMLLRTEDQMASYVWTPW